MRSSMVMSAAALRMAEQSATHLERAIHSQKAGFDRNVAVAEPGEDWKTLLNRVKEGWIKWKTP